MGGKGEGKTAVKTKLCTKFEAGFCSYGERCTFAHGESDLGSPYKPPTAKGKEGGDGDGTFGVMINQMKQSMQNSAQSMNPMQLLNGMKEAKAMGKIMLICRKLKTCQPEELDEIVRELAEALAQDLENCGNAKGKVEAESRKIV